MKKPLILDIKGNALDDGPGIRSVIFFKGCPLDCVWCHNPESKKPDPEISFDPKECVGCGACLGACPEKALSFDFPYRIDRTRCTLCMACAEACPSGALAPVGKRMEVQDIVSGILRYKPFFDTSGGGVTLSGGEPTLFPEFLSELLKSLKASGVHTLLETSGQFSRESFEKLILPFVDTIYMDIKFVSPHLHKKYCGISNDRILDNFRRLNALKEEAGIEILPRTPLVPGITDTRENLSAIAGFLRDQNVENASLLAYNPLWHDKNFKIGAENILGREEILTKWMTKERIGECEAVFEDAGISLV